MTKSRGAPKKDVTKAARIEIRETYEDKERLKNIADKKGITLASLITMVLKEYLAKEIGD